MIYEVLVLLLVLFHLISRILASKLLLPAPSDPGPVKMGNILGISTLPANYPENATCKQTHATPR